MIMILFFYIQLVVILACSTHSCTDTFRTGIENHLATKTPYRVIANRNDKEIRFKGCVPIRIWSIIRHGSRNPSRKVIHRVKENLTRIREKILGSTKSTLCTHELAMFRNWSFDVDEEEEKFLVYEGQDEMIELAERIQRRFPSLLPDLYAPNNYKFKYTATQRTLKSAESFAVGLFGRHKIKNITYPEPLHKDPVLRFYKLCNRWRAEVDKNPDALIEVRNFIKGNHVKDAVTAVKQKTGVHGLNIDDIHLMYMMCAFETAWSKQRVSPWCSLFDYNTIRVMEFIEDLEYYWIDGYGYDLTYQQACPAFSDMFNHINPSSSEPNATFYFTHSGTMLKLLAHLGLYKDEFILTHADYTVPRKWKVSKIDAFGSNLAFITFECTNEPHILVLHQERIVHLPGCPADKDLCPLKTIQRIYRKSLENCNFHEMCHISVS